MQVALCNRHGIQDGILFLEFVNILLLIVRIGDLRLAGIRERISIQAIRNFLNVGEEVQHVLVEIEAEAGLVQLNLVQDVFVLVVELRLLRLAHLVVG